MNLDSIKVNFDENTVIVEDKKIKLRPKEMEIFNVIFSKKGATATYDFIIENVYGVDSSDLKTLNVHIHNLNARLNMHGICIIAIRSRGYKLSDSVEKETPISQKIVEIKGEEKTVKEWCTFFGLTMDRIYYRHNTGRKIEECFFPIIKSPPLTNKRVKWLKY